MFCVCLCVCASYLQNYTVVLSTNRSRTAQNLKMCIHTDNSDQEGKEEWRGDYRVLACMQVVLALFKGFIENNCHPSILQLLTTRDCRQESGVVPSSRSWMLDRLAVYPGACTVSSGVSKSLRSDRGSQTQNLAENLLPLRGSYIRLSWWIKHKRQKAFYETIGSMIQRSCEKLFCFFY